MKKTALLLLAVLLTSPAFAGRIECITAQTIDADGLSANAIEVRGSSNSYNIEIYSSNDAESGSVTCTDEDGNAVTCAAGWDTATAEIFYRVDSNAPWTQMASTSTYSAQVNVGPVLLSRAQIRLKVLTGGNACLYLAVNGGGSESDRKATAQDESTNRGWAPRIKP